VLLTKNFSCKSCEKGRADERTRTADLPRPRILGKGSPTLLLFGLPSRYEGDRHPSTP
jgi:hypothetical protein